LILGRPSKPIITKERAARAALAVIDAEGISKLSLDLVARRLGVRAPSLFYHLKNKAELLAEVARIILQDVVVPEPRAGADWREKLVNLSLATRRSILRHPNAAPLLLEFFPRYLMLSSYNHWLPTYKAPPETHMLIIEGLEKLTFGSALFGAVARSRGIDPMPKFDAEKLPHLALALRSNPLDEEKTFEATLRRFLSAF
jgi:AcrR family transcriptional regulator